MKELITTTFQEQVKRMQDAASLKSVFPTKEHYSAAMGSFTIAGTEYDVWKVGKSVTI